MTDIHADMTELSEGRRGSLIDARPWLTKAKTAAAVAIVLSAASISLAKDSGLPTIDIEKLCRVNTDAVREVFTAGDLQGMDTCVADERVAREQLFKNWATYPASAEAACVQPQEYLPSYVEWQTCIEMTQAVLELRKRQEAAPSTTGSGASRQSSRRADPASADPASADPASNDDRARPRTRRGGRSYDLESRPSRRWPRSRRGWRVSVSRRPGKHNEEKQVHVS
jgi:hypothetical protein